VILIVHFFNFQINKQVMQKFSNRKGNNQFFSQVILLG